MKCLRQAHAASASSGIQKISNSYLFNHILQPFFIPTDLKNTMSPFSMGEPTLPCTKIHLGLEQ